MHVDRPAVLEPHSTATPPRRSARLQRWLVGALALAFAAGCLPDTADDDAVAAHLAALDPDANADGDAALGGDGAVDDGAVDDGAAGDGTAGLADAVTGDGTTADGATGDGTTGDGGDAADGGGSCDSDKACASQVTVTTCHVAACIQGECALVAVDAGSACTVTDLALKPCQQTTCDTKGACVVGTKADSAPCDADGSGCTQNDLCQDGSCVAGAAVVCPAGDSPCASPICVSDSPTTYACSPVFKGSGAPCDDGKHCTVGDACDGSGACLGKPNPCTNAGGPCTDGWCDLSKDACASKPKLKGAACATTPCKKGGTCDAAAACVGESNKCDDGNACTTDFCEEPSGTCKSTPHTGACEDGDPCTTADTCDGKGVCKAGAPLLHNVVFAVTKGESVVKVAALANGDALAVGRRNGQPWVARVSALGQLKWQLKEQVVGTWLAATELPNGTLLAVGNQGVLAGKEALVGHMTASGTMLKVAKIKGAGVSEARTVTVLGPDKVLITVNQNVLGPAPTLHTRTAAYPWTVSQASADKALFDLGGKDNSKDLYGVAEETAAQGGRLIYVGSEDVGGKKEFDGWIYRHDKKTGLFKGEANVGESTLDVLYDVAVTPAGYVAAGSSDSAVDGHAEAWVVGFSSDLKVRWQSRYSTDWGTWANGMVAHPDGSVLVVGQVITAKPTVTSKPWKGLLWRVGPFGETRMLRALGNNAQEQVLLGATVQGEGAQLFGNVGGPLSGELWSLRVDAWGYETCAKSGVCVSKSLAACDDGNPCTVATCAAAGGCGANPLGKGVACDDGKVCSKDDSKAKCEKPKKP